jgi:ankyrin repeat protein
LFYASSKGDVRVMKVLRNLAWRANIQDIDGRTPLNLASSSNNLAAVKFLANNGADIMEQDLRGDDPI